MVMLIPHENGNYFLQFCVKVSLFVLDLETNTLLPDCIPWVRFAQPCWNGDSTSFFYSKYLDLSATGTIPTTTNTTEIGTNENKNEGGFEEIDENEFIPSAFDLHNGIFYHVLGEDPKDDICVFGCADYPNWIYGL